MPISMRASFLAPVLAAAIATAGHAQPAGVLTGEAAFGGWRSDAPGMRRLIRPDDLPPPFATRSVGNGPGIVRRQSSMAPEVPEGFAAELVAEGLSGPRTMRIATNGDVFVVESRGDRVTVLGETPDAPRTVFASGLASPYGLAFYPPGPSPRWLYVGETGRIVRFRYRPGQMQAEGPPEVIARLPTGGHWTRDIAFAPDGSRLYVAVGSQSNVAAGMSRQPPGGLAAWEAARVPGAAWGIEEDRAALLVFDPDGSDGRIFATGIRNCSGLTIQPATGTPWCANNERDGLGDDLPPDYATAVREGGFYGWPWFYIGGNEDPRHAGARPDLAGAVDVPDVLLQPHSAPLGIAFYEAGAFPAQYRGDAFVALHGSWNRAERTGYKVVRLIVEDGAATGTYEDFVTGFVLSERAVWGRPVGVTVDADGALLVSEDANGTIWRIRAR